MQSQSSAFLSSALFQARGEIFAVAVGCTGARRQSSPFVLLGSQGCSASACFCQTPPLSKMLADFSQLQKSKGGGGAKQKLAKARTKLPLLANFEDLIDDAFDSYKKLPAIPDAKGRLPGQKRKPKTILHLPPLDPIRFPTLSNSEPNGLALDPTAKFKQKVVEEEDEERELTVQEKLAAALRQASARVLDLFRSWDTDGDGQVDREEFIRAFEQIGRGLMEGLDVRNEQIGALFDEWDADGGGSISFDELKKILSRRPKPASRRRRPARVRPDPRLCYSDDSPEHSTVSLR